MRVDTMRWLALAAVIALLLAGGGQAIAQTTCGQTTWDLTAGQTTNVGTVAVCNDANNIYVTYTLTYPNAKFGTLQVWVGNSLLNLPSNQNGTPIPGQFCNALGGDCFDATGLTTHTFTIPFSELNITDAAAACGGSLYVVTHAEVDMDGDPSTPEHETAFGGPTPGSGPRWWFYGEYTICCDFGQPPLYNYETAFAKGGYVFASDKKANPENLPSLKLAKQRWGWAINLTAPGTTYYDIWAGAGLNRTASEGAVKVGTLTVVWDGANVTLTYAMDAGFLIQEVHVYAADPRPTTIAPGQYGYLDSWDPAGTPTTGPITLPLADVDGTGGVWLIAHAVVAIPY